MKSLQVLAFSAVLLIPPLSDAAPAPGEVQQLLTEAQAAFFKGDLETAKTDFELVRQLDPRNPTAIGYLRTISVQEAQRAKEVTVERQLRALVIPKLEFKEATLGAALDYMKKTAEKLSGGKVAANFVVQLPAEQVNTQTVTLSLSNIPYTEALRYIGGLTGLTFSYDKYAITVKPKTDAASSASTGSTAPPVQPK